MSTSEWTHPVTEKKYQIGTIGTEYFKSEGFFSFFKDISTNMANVKDVAIFTALGDTGKIVSFLKAAR
jgi:hypothetical protein